MFSEMPMTQEDKATAQNTEPQAEEIPNTRRKVFFGLFVFPMLIAVTMAVLLSAIVLLTHEDETPESLVTAIKTGAPSKRWQKAYELSNELNRPAAIIRGGGMMNEVIHILNDKDHYDAKTRAYMAMALSRFKTPEAEEALLKALSEVTDTEDPKLALFLLWATGSFEHPESSSEVTRFLSSTHDDLRKTAAYVLGVLGDQKVIPELERSLEDAQPDVRWNAALSLARLGSDSGWKVLAQMMDRNYFSQFRQSMNEQEVEQVMTNAAKGLGLIHRPETQAVLEHVSKTDSNLKVRQAALSALEQPSLRGGVPGKAEAISNPA